MIDNGIFGEEKNVRYNRPRPGVYSSEKIALFKLIPIQQVVNDEDGFGRSTRDLKMKDSPDSQTKLEPNFLRGTSRVDSLLKLFYSARYHPRLNHQVQRERGLKLFDSSFLHHEIITPATWPKQFSQISSQKLKIPSFCSHKLNWTIQQPVVRGEQGAIGAEEKVDKQDESCHRFIFAISDSVTLSSTEARVGGKLTNAWMLIVGRTVKWFGNIIS